MPDKLPKPRRGKPPVWTVIHPAKETDIAVEGEFAATAIAAVGWSVHLAVDFSKVTFMHFGGIRVIVWTQKSARAVGGQLVLVGLTDRLRRMLE